MRAAQHGALFGIGSGGGNLIGNNNGVTDLIDILNGTADTDNDGFPDVCEPTCAADVTGGGPAAGDGRGRVAQDSKERHAAPDDCRSRSA